MPMVRVQIAADALKQPLISSVSEPVHRMLLAPWDLHSATDLFGHPRRSNLLHGAIRAADLTQ
jgi:hypothetical protein